MSGKPNKSKNSLLSIVIVAIFVIAFLLFNGKDLFTSGNDSSTVAQQTEQTQATSKVSSAEYHFRNSKLLNEHFKKHGSDFDYASAEEYEAGASAVATSSEAMHKTEAEDGDDVYYIESTNEFVIVSEDGYIRTYFKPSAGIDYYNRQ